MMMPDDGGGLALRGLLHGVPFPHLAVAQHVHPTLVMEKGTN